MKEHLGFLKTSIAVVKIAAWIFLLIGIAGGITLFFRDVAEDVRWVAIFGAIVYVFLFFLLYLFAKIADLLIKIINEIKKEEELLEKDLAGK